jgi:hypothetical protein
MITALKVRRPTLQHTQRMRTKVILTRLTGTQVTHIITPTVIHTAMGILIGRTIHILGFTPSIVVMGIMVMGIMGTTIITMAILITTAIPGAYTPMARGIQVS